MVWGGAGGRGLVWFIGFRGASIVAAQSSWTLKFDCLALLNGHVCMRLGYLECCLMIAFV